ncbi:DUF2382 domain-containing protein [Planococcus sp. ISL-109]|uniref:DUF2382 domain-containing protein n=1 Tax=Planococcus sp. ISL-109 TaxID=2819166 RepID=UPI001BEA9054|nr:DUF2382 domain-containing protein [Planococcus sp. ISL-109]MBT2582791.1 DUF2382 domain-containing protein [Planococcus sp. ISL-109]
MQKHGHKLIGMFDVQAEVLHEISELKAQGYKEEDMYVVALNDQQLQMVQGQTDVHLNTDTGDFMDKFTSFISGEDPTKDAFLQMGLSETEAGEYYQHVQNGKLVLYVDSEYGMNYQNFDAAAERLTGNHGSTEPEPNDEQRIKLHEERLAVDKEWTETGSVDIHKKTVEEELTLDVPYEREEVEVERRPVNKELSEYEATGASTTAYEKDGYWHIPVIEERLEVRKVKYVSEEIIVQKHKIQETKQVRETVRREVVDIDENNAERFDKP